MVDVESDTNLSEAETTQGLENPLMSEDEDEHDDVCYDDEEDTEGVTNNGVGGCTFEDATAVNDLEDISRIDFKNLSPEDFMRYHFLDVGVAFTFYNWYASFHGFAGRKSKVMRNKSGDITQQTFVCYRQGKTEQKGSSSTSRKRVQKPRVRCGCEAKCCVHIEGNSGRWFTKVLHDAHNHTLLDDQYMGMLPAHRKMTDYDIWRMSNMKKVGIKTSQVYGFFASQAGGYNKVGFRRRDMYNEQERQRLTSNLDAKSACEFLESLRASDETMFWRHRVDDQGRLSHLFWCDGAAQRDYLIFGDVLAFDATYKRNKYLCPLVVFSGVNHHNQSIVFAGAIVCDETEQTYVWLLKQFLEAMGGKCPTSVITDGDLAMRNAIGIVFPQSHHRLCAWHLIRNACTNIGKTNFVKKFKQCMLGDYDVGEFKRKWDKLLIDFGLQDNKWVRDMYDKRHMWATAHIRGKFFAGFRTTSRCEGLHAQFGRYVNYQNNLLEFLQQFFRCLNYMRYSELEADFGSIHGEPVLETPLPLIERAAGEMYTREIFLLFQSVLRRSCTCTVVDSRQTVSCYFYTVIKYPKDNVRLLTCNLSALVRGLSVLRWTKNAKDSINMCSPTKTFSSEPTMICQFSNVVERCKRMANAAVKCGKPRLMRQTIEMIDAQTKVLEAACTNDGSIYVNNRSFVEKTILNPPRVRTKGCGSIRSSSQTKSNHQGRKPQSCGVCGVVGHNKTSCPVQKQTQHVADTQADSNAMNGDYEDEHEEYGNIGNIDMNTY